MAVKIKLTRLGKIRNPQYRIAEAGRSVELVEADVRDLVRAPRAQGYGGLQARVAGEPVAEIELNASGPRSPPAERAAQRREPRLRRRWRRAG